MELVANDFDGVSVDGRGFIFVRVGEQIIGQVVLEPSVLFDVPDRCTLHRVHLHQKEARTFKAILSNGTII